MISYIFIDFEFQNGYRADLHISDVYRLPLHNAAKNNHVELIEYLAKVCLIE